MLVEPILAGGLSGWPPLLLILVAMPTLEALNQDSAPRMDTEPILGDVTPEQRHPLCDGGLLVERENPEVREDSERGLLALV